MSFRPSILDICRATFAGCICLAFTAAVRGQDLRSQAIEVVPLHGTTIDTNANQSQPAGTKNFEGLFPLAPRTFHLTVPSSAPPPPQRPVIEPTEREKELLDRRKNWVFMTPDDMLDQAETDASGQDKDKNKDGTDKKPMTAMERYFQHLYDSDRQVATNQTARIDSNPSTKTNSAVAE
jgi:hypothetical protein